MSREFCPKSCEGLKDNRICTARTYLSDWDRSKDRCWHLDDVALDKPIPAQVKKAGEWMDSEIVGHNKDRYIVREGNWNIEPSLTWIHKNAPFIKRK